MLPSSNTEPRTRFKTWWRLVGSAVEYAAGLCGSALDFQTVFLEQEEEDEETASLVDALNALATKWSDGQTFKAADVARVINDHSDYSIDRERGTILREFLFPEHGNRSDQTVSPKAVGKRLKRHIDEPVQSAAQTLCLKLEPKPPGNADIAGSYSVRCDMICIRHSAQTDLRPGLYGFHDYYGF